MTELTQQEIEQIYREAEERYPEFNINECAGPIDMEKRNSVVFLVRGAYAAALTSERLKHKAEIQAYREFLKYVVTARDNVSKEMMAVFAENLIVRFQ